MTSIQVLPDALVNQIAAGEVVERPASVVKELVENALDAGARRVSIDVERGGVARIAVADDGSGMGPEDARLALERHATSKIRSFGDLQAIGTLGFRGEALPSIASVSRLTLTTSPDASGLGTEVLAERGAEPRVAPARHTKGTRVVVEELFGNVPARRKFLKGPEAELKAIVRATTAQALARPDVAIVLRAGAKVLLDLAAVRDVEMRFVETLGRATLGEVVPVAYSAFGMTLTGAVSRPEVTFASRTHQWFFVNGRAARDATVAHAALLAVREALRSDRHPAFALFLKCDPAACDVNVHPQKHEVRFKHPNDVHSLVHRGLLAALGGAKSPVALSGERLEMVPAQSWGRASAQSAPVAALAEAIGVYGANGDRAASQSMLMEPAAAALARSAYPAALVADSPLGTLRLLGQYRDSFLLAESEIGLVVIDQHVAHERVRYERILARFESVEPASQRLLLPVTYEATPEEAAALSRAEELLAGAGFVLSELSGREFLVSAAPPDCAAEAVVPFLRDLLARLLETPESVSAGCGRRELLAASLACRGAVTVNTPLRPEEATRLLSDLTGCRDPFTCPHGRPILLTLSHGELLKRFGRRT